MFYFNAATKAAVVYCVSNFIAISGKRKCRKYINLSYPIKGRLEFQCGVSDNFYKQHDGSKYEIAFFLHKYWLNEN